MGRPVQWLLIYCLASSSRIFLLNGDTTIVGERLQNLNKYSAIRAFEQREGSLSCYTCCDMGLWFSGLIQRTIPCNRLLHHTRGCGGSVLAQILTGRHLVAYNDTQGDFEDLFLSRSSRVPVKLMSTFSFIPSFRVQSEIENSETLFNTNLTPPTILQRLNGYCLQQKMHMKKKVWQKN
jgi:hypothetical protein